MLDKTLGSYRIEAQIGTGGMGVVYRATDIRLGRKVAIKVLPSSAVANPDRERRLIQEARAASALNHPNIVTIYEIDHCEQDGQTTSFIAMEFVPGTTLAQLIDGKGLRVRDAVKYAIQIADALAAAHAAGIVHRDLKPTNVMITPQGTAKILDFGLAKLNTVTEPDAYADTIVGGVGPVTEAGMVLGTVAYVSPEQAEGRPLDARSDIFSFGSVLYEMLAGKQAFPGTSKLSSLSAVLTRDPQPVSQAIAGVPAGLEKLIQRCLKKDPARRWQNMADVKVALEELLEELDAVRVEPEEGEEPARAKSGAWPARVADERSASQISTAERLRYDQSAEERVAEQRPARSLRGILAWLALGVLAGLALAIPIGSAVVKKWFAPQPPSFKRLTFRRGDVTSAKFGPGGAVVFSAAWDGAPSTIYSTLPGSREARELGLPGGTVMAVSSSGEMAILLGDGPTGTLAQASLGGGAPRQILENVSGADWGPDGTSLAVVRMLDGKQRIEFPIGTVLYQTEGRPPLFPHVSGDGKLVAFFDFDKQAGDYSVSIVGPGRAKQVLARGLRGIGGMSWSPDGKEIWFSAVQGGSDPMLYAVDLHANQRTIMQSAGFIVLQDLAPNGEALMNSVNSRLGITYYPASGSPMDLSWFDASADPQISDDGKLMLFQEVSALQGPNPAIYLRKTDGSAAVLLGYGYPAALSPDNKWVLSFHRDAGGARLVLLPTGPGEPRTLSSGGVTLQAAEWFPDNKRLLVSGNEAGKASRSWIYSLENDSMQPLTAEGVRATKVSPDEKFYVVADAKKVLLAPLAGGAVKTVAELDAGQAVVRWSSDPRYLFLRKVEGATAEVTRLDVASGRKEPWRTLQVPELGASFLRAVTLPADGKACAATFQHDLANLYEVSGLR